jgi:hypothetical protein
MQGAPDRRPVLLLYLLHAQHRVQKAMGSRSTSRSTLILFTRATVRTKSKRLLIRTSLYFLYAFIIDV